MNTSIIIQNQLLATKFFVPTAMGELIARPRLVAQLNESFKYPLTLISAPAGFGKTTLLSSWIHSLPENRDHVAWVSLDEEDNEPQVFWSYLLSALDQQDPERFSDLFRFQQSLPPPPIKQVLANLSNLVAESKLHYLLILDDYHLISEPQIHQAMAYLLEHLAPQFHLFLTTRTDPPLPLAQLRARGQLLEIRAEQLRCQPQETRDFFQHVMNIHLPEEIVKTVTTRTEGWLVGLQLLGLGLQGQPDSITLLPHEISGDQRYILDYLTEEVLQRQPEDMQNFLLSTCILEQLTAPLCDAVTDQTGSQQMLKRLEENNLFVVSLDNHRAWYRYHALFAEALAYHLQQNQPDLLPILHHRASLWYAEQKQITTAILHAFRAQAWPWAADLIEQKSRQMMERSWGARERELLQLQEWMEQMPAEIIGSRPRLCLACVWVLWQVTPHSVMERWLSAAETQLKAALNEQVNIIGSSKEKQQDLLGETITWRAILRSYQEDGEHALSLCQQALTLLRADNYVVRSYVSLTQVLIYFHSSVNNATLACQSGLQAITQAQATEQTALAINMIGTVAAYLIGAGQLHQAHQLTQEAIELGKRSENGVPPQMCFPLIFQAEILREWNQLDAALSLVQEAIALGEQTSWIVSLLHALYGYMILLRIELSRGNLQAAQLAFEKIERLGNSMEPHIYNHACSLFATTDQVRLWLTNGNLGRATRWIEELDVRRPQSTLLAYERREVARARIFLAQKQPEAALERLEPVLQRATIGGRRSHLLEIYILQALAHQLLQQEPESLAALATAVQLGEPEGYISSFVDEGPVIATLLGKLRHESSPTEYLDKLLASFPREKKTRTRKRRQG